MFPGADSQTGNQREPDQRTSKGFIHRLDPLEYSSVTLIPRFSDLEGRWNAEVGPRGIFGAPPSESEGGPEMVLGV